MIFPFSIWKARIQFLNKWGKKKNDFSLSLRLFAMPHNLVLNFRYSLEFRSLPFQDNDSNCGNMRKTMQNRIRLKRNHFVVIFIPYRREEEGNLIYYHESFYSVLPLGHILDAIRNDKRFGAHPPDLPSPLSIPELKGTPGSWKSILINSSVRIKAGRGHSCARTTHQFNENDSFKSSLFATLILFMIAAD